MARKTPKPPATSCSTCAYWIRDQSERTESDWGECKKNPPTLFFDPEMGLGAAWPPTDDTDYCGQWYARLNS